MKKRILSLALCAAMAATAMAGCTSTSTSDPTTAAPTTAEATTEAPAKSNVPQDYKYYYSFDQKDDKAEIEATGQDKAQSGADILFANGKDKVYINGVKGEAIYTDGSYGYRLKDFKGLDSKTYTISFWTYATRSAQYMPSVQYGPDMHGDVTGGQHYMNFTFASWNSDSLTYPSIWSYDQADDGNWPFWNATETGDGIKKWQMITLVVDENVVSADGRTLQAKLYIDGEEFVNVDSDGNALPINVVNGTMAKSDTFDMCLGINYWDAIYKGAFDEMYVYDYALDAAAIKALYADADPSVKFEEPAHEFVVVTNPDAIAALGATDFSVAEAMYNVDTPIANGQKMVVKMTHFSDGKDTANNYFFVFKDADGNEVARLTADLQFSLNGDALALTTEDMFVDGVFQSWGNWNTWESSVMRDADVTAEISIEGKDIIVNMSNVDYNGSDNTVAIKLTAEKDVASFTIGTKNSYTEILGIASAEYDPNIYAFYGVDGSYIVNYPVVIGAEDGTSGFWSEFSNTFAVPAGETKTIGLTIKHGGSDNWNNVFAVLQNVGGVHNNAVNDKYKEYAVVRADNFGWGDSYVGGTTDVNFDTMDFPAIMNGAHVDVAVTNNTTSADVVMTIKGSDGNTYVQKYEGMPIDGDLFFCVGVDGSCIELDSTAIGAEDGTSGFWSQFSEVMAIAPGATVVSTFKVAKAGADNWNNVFVAITNAAYGQAASTRFPNYAEYAVLRADNFGWGNTWGTQAMDCTWDFEAGTMPELMNGSDVVLSITNNGDGTADIKFNFSAVNGTINHMYYTGLNVAH